MTLKQLEYLVAVADSGSISAAAEKLNISQPPLSMQIKALEEELGLVLFDRSTRYLRPTDACHKLCEKARQILDMVSEAEAELTVTDNQLTGKLVIGTISSCGFIVLNNSFNQFIKDHPDVNYELVEGNTFSVLDKLKKHELDLAFVRTPFDDTDLVSCPVNQEPICAVATEEFFQDESPITLKELSSYPLIIYRRYESIYRKAFKKAGSKMKIRCLNDDARTTLMWASAGCGVGLVPKSIAPLISRPNLYLREITSEELITGIHIVYRKGQYLSPAAREFISLYK